jgi:hypothetical protein
MSENLQKLIGVAAMAVLVVVGVVVSSGDDTDFTRNRSLFAATAMSSGTAKADCCDETLALLGSMQTQLTDNSSQLAENSSKLQALLDTESEASSSGASPDVEEIADQMAAACPSADAANWTNIGFPGHGAFCVREYLVGFPLELARLVVLTHGRYGFFHRFNLDLASQFPITHQTGGSNAQAVVTEEACQQIFYGYNPPPRFAVFVDTKDGLVLPSDNEFSEMDLSNGMIQYLKDTALIYNATAGDVWSWKHHWPTTVANNGFCE